MPKGLHIFALMLALCAVAQGQPAAGGVELFGGLESTKAEHRTRWVFTGDTITKEEDNVYGTVYFLDGYWITCTETTQDLWEYYMHYNNSSFKGDSLPVTDITPAEAMAFADTMSRMLRERWRLPTKEEWLFAFNGGVDNERYTYSGSNNHHFVAWTKTNSGGRPHIVGQLIPNSLRLFDMSGNVEEICSSQGNATVVMGGSYMDDESALADSGKAIGDTTNAGSTTGFRLVRHYPLWVDKYGNRVMRHTDREYYVLGDKEIHVNKP